MAIDVAPTAYAKMMLHVAKHPSASCLGFLLGSVSSSSADGASGADVTVVDVVPLFHHQVLAPSLEVAAQLTDQQGHAIVGVYHCNARVSDDSVAIVVEQVANKLDQQVPGAVLVQVVNRRLEEPDDHALAAWGRDKKNGWKRNLAVRSEGSGDFEAALALASRAVSAQLQRALVDFDDHFEDAVHDPHNPGVTAALRELT